VQWLGDGALVVPLDTTTAAHALALAVTERSWPGVEDVVVGERAMTLVADPVTCDVAALAEELARLPPAAPAAAGGGRRVEIPVAFDGPDLEDVAAIAGISPDAVADRLEDAVLTVSFLGFLPGFAYLTGLPGPLASVGRRPTPRTAVPAGSVALAGGFAGVYPQASPGGWHVVGRTGMALFDPDSPPFAALAVGDRVRLRAVGEPGSPALRPRRPLVSATASSLVVEDPGLLSLVEDRGRVGVAGLGVPRAGAADPFALRAANRLVGNADDAAGVEVTAAGPSLRFTGATHAAVVGEARVSLDGRPVPADAVLPVAAGQVLAIGRVVGAMRAYVAVCGGVDIPVVLGSRSSDVRTRLGAGALRTGDVLGTGPPVPPHGHLVRHGEGGARVLRVLPGPDGFGPGELDRLCAGAWEVGSDSDRMGVRLRGADPLAPPASPGSRGVVTGAVQVPADGQPVVLSCDHGTVGGYPVIACVVTADLGVVGRCRPGDTVRFELVDLATARRARAAAERALERGTVGWYPVRSD